MGIPYPLINGNLFDFSSTEITANGVLFLGGFKEISYSTEVKPGEVRGNRAQIVGRTRGTLSHMASAVMFKSEYQQLIAMLGEGFMAKQFNIGVAYSEVGLPVINDSLIGLRIIKAEDKAAEGSEPLTVSLTFHVMNILYNGQPALDKMLL